MSTSYYNFKKPVTCVKVKMQGSHAKVSIFVNHALAGELTLWEEELGDFLNLFVEFGTPIFHSHYGGKDKGEILEQIRTPSGEYVMSENLETFSVSYLREIIAMREE